MPKILGVNTITVAVDKIERVKEVFEVIFGMKASPVLSYPEDNYNNVIFHLDERTMFELLEPTGAESPVAKLVEKKGVGFFHVGLEVENLDEAIAELQKAGIKVSSSRDYGDLMKGWESWKEVYISPVETSGALIALIERRARRTEG